MKKAFLLVSIAMLSIVSMAQNFTAGYTFDSVKTTSGLVDPTPVPIITGVAFGNFSAVGTSANPNSTLRFNYTNWPIGATSSNDMYSSLTGSVNTSEYYEITVAPENGYTLDLTDITFSVQRSSTGIRTYVVRSSMDGYVSNLSASINPTNSKLSVQTGNVFFWNLDATTTNQNGSTITLGGMDFADLSNPVTFRFYGYNSEGSVGTFSIDNVMFTGTATALTTGLTNKAGAINAFNIYPNPSVNGVFTLDLKAVSTKTTITVYTIIGKLLFTKEINPTDKNNIDLADEPNGSYFMTIKNDIETFTRKIIINK